MANFELTVRYLSKDAQFWRTTLLLSSPVWAVAIPVCCAFVCSFILYKTDYNPNTVISIIAALLLVSLSCLFACILFMDNRIVLSSTGVRFPPFLTMFSAHTGEVDWSKVQELTVESILPDPDNDMSKLPLDEMQLQFKMVDGDAICLLAQDISQLDREKLLLAFNTWLPQRARHSSLVYLQEVFKAEFSGVSNATFAPLKPDYVFPGRFLEVISCLSVGPQLAVYFCQEKGIYDRILNEYVVPEDTPAELKIIARQILEKEAAVWLKLDHPQIAKIVQVFNENDRIYVLLEFIEGKSLRQIVEEEGMQSEKRVISIAKSICCPLAYLQNLKPPVLRKNLSPESIFVQDNIATMVGTSFNNEFLSTINGAIAGNPAYLAPEQISSQANSAGDFYSFGATLHFLLTGSDPLPLTTSSPKDFFEKLSIEEKPISLLMDQLIQDLTSLDEAGRIQSVETLVKRLDEFG